MDLRRKNATWPLDVDMVLLFGYGFPHHRDGPFHYEDTLGPQELIRRIEIYDKKDRHYCQVPYMLRQMAADETKFSDLNVWVTTWN